MTDSVFNLAVDENKIAVVTIDVPGEKMNTLRSSFADDLKALLEDAKSQNVKGMVFISGKSDSFIAGADVKMLDSVKKREDALAISELCHQAFFDMTKLPYTTVSAIHGAALGGGLEFALACDYRVGTDSDLTKIGLPEVQLGLLPGGGGTQRLTKIVGIQKALEWMLTGKQIRPTQAKKAGVLDDCVPHSVLLKVAKEFATKKKPQAKEPKLDNISKLLESNPFGRNFIFKKAKENVLKKRAGTTQHHSLLLKLCELV